MGVFPVRNHATKVVWSIPYRGYSFIVPSIKGNQKFNPITRLDIAIDDRNEIPYFTIEQIKRKCLKDEFVSKSKSYRFAESSFDEDTAKTVYIGDGKSNISYRFYDKDKEQAGKYQLPYEEIAN